MKRRCLAVFMAVFLCGALSGCRYSHEITDMAYTVALGLDKGEDSLKVSFQFARPLAIGGGSKEGGSGGSSEGGEEEEKAPKNKNTTMLTIEADDFYTALSVAENSLSKEINLSHTKLLLFSEKLAQDNISDLTTMFMKNSQFSPNTFVAVSLSPAEEYMRMVNPSLEVNPAKYYTLIFSKNNSDYMPQTTLRDLYFDLSAPGQEPVLPVANIDKESDEQKQNEETTQGDYEAGELSKGSENETDVSGMAVLSGGKLSGVLSSQETIAYHMLTGKMKEVYLTLPSLMEDGKHITLRLTQDKKPKNCVELTESAPKINSKVKITAEIVECPNSDLKELGLDGLNRLASLKVKQNLESFLEQTRSFCQADIVGYGRLAKMKFKDYPTWTDYDWQEKYKDAEISVIAEVNISREGLVHTS